MTQYGNFIQLAQRLIAGKGIKVTYGFLEPEYADQTTDDTRIENITEVDVVFRTGFHRRQAGTFLPRNELSALMGAVDFKPKTGDYLITPKDKRYPIDEITVIAPDGEPVLSVSYTHLTLPTTPYV